ncbi:hypothetical protein [Scytonema sp. PCC 10023]
MPNKKTSQESGNKENYPETPLDPRTIIRPNTDKTVPPNQGSQSNDGK